MMRLPVTTLVVALAASVSYAETFHVATTGSNSAAGTDAAPWATLQHAADEVGPGDTVIVHAGDYQGFNLETSGTSGAPIVFKADGDARITSNNPETTDGINLEGASYVTIEGFTITGTTRAGIRAVTCEHVTVRGVRADQNGRWGIFTGFCDDLLIEDNETSRSGAEHGIYVSNSGDRPVIRNNKSWGNNANGIHMNGDISTGGDGVISNAVVEGNIIYGNGDAGGSGINGDGEQDAIIRNNLLFD
ncbi:MAG: right-handed parallel beta-helix repeat-containing protein, partial [Kofleriaceae bacterium]